MNGFRAALLPCSLADRRAAVAPHAPFAALADSLAVDLEPWLDAPMPRSLDKARLTSAGGRCPIHGIFLDFDPARPHAHRCGRCDQDYVGRVHDQWWAMGAHLWTAERAVHAAALFALRGDARHAALASRIVREYAARYATWPNDDNVLGPSRLFFSTYLESIWLLNLCHAVSLLELSEAPGSANDAVSTREQLIAPAMSIVASYDERGSNRQVWNEAAICSALRLLGRDDEARVRLHATHGVRWQLAHGLDDDGFWYEGENYHLFAHRGLWYGVQLMRVLDVPLEPALATRYANGFLAPFGGVLPDETFPSRRDSQYASSIRQWRTAEWCELGWAESHDRRLSSVLTRLYDASIPRRETRRAMSTADAERNTPATSLTRADLSWRALLMAEPMLPRGAVAPPASVVLPRQGLAVIRRDLGRTYVALEGGETGGGHGHPDQLALTLQCGPARWLEDPGTGSYVERELHWYRSSMAHMAPFVDGLSQHPVEATLVAFEDRGGLGWMQKRLVGIADGVQVDRTIVVGEHYVLDVLEWSGLGDRELLLPIASEADVRDVDGARWKPRAMPPAWTPATDVWEMASDVEWIEAGERIEFDAYPTYAEPGARATRSSIGVGTRGERTARAWYATSASAQLARMVVPDAPGRDSIHRHMLSVQADHGCIVGVWALPSDRGGIDVTDVVLTPRDAVVARIVTMDGTAALHSRAPHGWHVELLARGARSSIDLEGLRDPASTANGQSASVPVVAPTPVHVFDLPLLESSALEFPPGTPNEGAIRVELAEHSYVRTEWNWEEAGCPSATVALGCTRTSLIVDVDARTGPVKPVHPTMDVLDNELPGINLSGVQWYVARADVPAAPTLDWFAAGLHIVGDERHTGPHGVAVPVTGAPITPTAMWRATEQGWAMRLVWPLARLPIDATGALDFEFVVNDCPPTRDRRRGQLVLSGGGGFGYLAGPRRPTNRFVRLQFPVGTGKTTLR